MRKHNFVLGFLCVAAVFSSITVLANTDVLARLTSQTFFWNGERIELEAYNINDYNYVRLRDAAGIFGVDVTYDEQTGGVYLGEPPAAAEPVTSVTVSEIDGTAYAREDFSQYANPDIFDAVYTREAYNAMRQSVIDIETIAAGTNEDGYNPNYQYAHFVDHASALNVPGPTIEALKSVSAHMFGYYTFSFGFEPGIKGLRDYPGYCICEPQIHVFFEPANRATDAFIESLSGLSDREKIKRIADNVSDRIVYKDEDVAGINRIFTSNSPVNGTCGSYSNAFIYLCQRAKIPCVSVQDHEHAWNEVYADGRWYTADIGLYDLSRTDSTLLLTTFHRTDGNLARTKFAKELLVPMSTR